MSTVLFWALCVLSVLQSIHSKHLGSSTNSTGHPQIEPRAQSCQCGKKYNSRIVGGSVTDVNEYPWMAALCGSSPCNFNAQFCGGSIISDQYILTAAHCVDGENPEDVFVSLGDHNINTESETDSEEFGVSEIKIHGNYQPGPEKNDIALLKLDRQITFKDTISPVCLPPATPLYGNKVAVTIGWGSLSSGGSFPTTLREVAVKVLPNRKCKRIYRGVSITSKMLCAGSEGKDSCQGDSGGPLMFRDQTNSFDQIGVVSFGIGCGGDYPGVYTRVNKYLTWINNRITDSNKC